MSGPSVFCICYKSLILKETNRTKKRTKTPFRSAFLVRSKASKIKELSVFEFLPGPLRSDPVRSGPKSRKPLKTLYKKRTKIGPKSDRSHTWTTTPTVL